MRIYSMSATFGKLEHQTLTLEPGLNVIEAPNEWGKSTWCAFLISMLYGIDTRAKSTRSQLADKERFVPWSGSPMEGSIDLNWNGRDITVQRWTKGRIPMGEFRAFETASGLDVPELNAENCGQQLLGVEKDVFTRAGFLRFTDLPVTEDEQLRSRLNALVTTGDESGSAQLLEQKLKELKNRCRYNRSGLLPQARQQKEQLEQRMEEYRTLDRQTQQLNGRIEELEQHIHRLENHKAALRHFTALNGAAMLREAQAARDQAQSQVESLRDQVEVVPSRENAMKNIQKLTKLKENMDAISMEEQMLPLTSSLPEPPQGFEGCTAREAVLQAQQHYNELAALRPKANVVGTILLFLGSFLLFFAVFLFFFDRPIWSLLAAGMGLLYLLFSFVFSWLNKRRLSQYRKRMASLSYRYGINDPKKWLENAKEYAQAWKDYTGKEDDISTQRGELDSRKEELLAKSMTASRARGLSNALEYWNDILSLWDEYADARCTLRQAKKHLQNVRSMTTDAPPPQEDDDLTFTEEETHRMLSDASHELKQLLSKRGQFLGQLEALGSLEAMEQENLALEQRILQLEQIYAASELALKSLEQATAQLQRRFSPRISETAQQILSRLTNGRYNRLTLTEDFSVQASAENETVLRSRHWRSDGTVDQLYLALRLAVARELTPNAPLVLDDAMVRFDTVRLQAALDILRLEAETKQVIVFTCHGREKELLSK